MSDARKALANLMSLGVDAVLDNPNVVFAALVEHGWTPTVDDLRIFGGRRPRVLTESHLWAFNGPQGWVR